MIRCFSGVLQPGGWNLAGVTSTSLSWPTGSAHCRNALATCKCWVVVLNCGSFTPTLEVISHVSVLCSLLFSYVWPLVAILDLFYTSFQQDCGSLMYIVDFWLWCGRNNKATAGLLYKPFWLEGLWLVTPVITLISECFWKDTVASVSEQSSEGWKQGLVSDTQRVGVVLLSSCWAAKRVFVERPLLCVCVWALFVSVSSRSRNSDSHFLLGPFVSVR